MSKARTPDVIDWFGALERAFAEVQTDPPTVGPEARCLCGSTDARARILFAPVDLTAEDVACQPLTVPRKQCRACGHYVHEREMAVVRYYGDTTTIRDHYHPECVRF